MLPPLKQDGATVTHVYKLGPGGFVYMFYPQTNKDRLFFFIFQGSAESIMEHFTMTYSYIIAIVWQVNLSHVRIKLDCAFKARICDVVQS